MKCDRCGQRLESEKAKSKYFLSMTNAETSMQFILEILSEEMGVTLAHLRRSRRDVKSVFYRQIFIKLATEFTKASYPMIGQMINRDHTSAMHLDRKSFTFEGEIIYNKLRDKVEQKVISSSLRQAS